MTSQNSWVKQKTEILDSLTLDKGLSKILTSSTTNTAANALIGLRVWLLAKSAILAAINKYNYTIWVLLNSVNHISATASTELAATHLICPSER